MRSAKLFAQHAGGKIEQAVCVLQFVFGQPVRVGRVQQCEVVEFAVKFGWQPFAFRQCAEFGRRQLMLLEFIEQSADFLCKAWPAGAAAE